MERIKGVNLGGWLLMEGYILGGRNIAESAFKRIFKNINGDRALKDFEKVFRDNFITEGDFKKISQIGANAVRVPFHFRLVEKKPYVYSLSGLRYLERVFRWARKHKLGVILDLHAAPGSQNHDWHSDSEGRARFWEKAAYRRRTTALWEVLADKFKDQEGLIGYDILNEPVLAKSSRKALLLFYSETIKRIRAVDKTNKIFVEGDNWAQDIDFLKELTGDNICVSIHNYIPLNYVFNFTPFRKFPGRSEGGFWSRSRIRKRLKPYYEFSRKNQTQIFVGEFGINWRGGYWGEKEWLKSVLSVYDEFNFHYTYWTYKTVANHVFPTGILQLEDNREYINRQGPLYGWETYPFLWRRGKAKIADFFRSGSFTENRQLTGALSRFFKEGG